MENCRRISLTEFAQKLMDKAKVEDYCTVVSVGERWENGKESFLIICKDNWNREIKITVPFYI